MKQLLFSLMLVFGATMTSHSQAVNLYTGGYFDSNLYVYDTTGGSFTLINTMTMVSDFSGTIDGCYGLSLDPSSQQMYVLYQDGGGNLSRRLGILDTTSGAITDIGVSGNLTDITFFGSELFGSTGQPDGYNFVRVNKTDATTTSLFAHPTAGYGHTIWWDVYNDKLYKSTQEIATFSEIDTITMTETTLASGSHPGWTSSSVQIDDSTAIVQNGGGGTLSAVNTNTWSFINIGGFTGGHAMAFNQFPFYIIVSGPTVFCDNENVTELASSVSGTAYQWFLDGAPIAGATDSTHVPVASGLYTLDADGSLTNPVSITVHAAPVASFTAVPNPLDLGFIPSGDVDFTNTSTGGNDYQWDFDTGIQTTLENPTYSFPSTGFFDITFVVTVDSTGCSDTATVTIAVINSTGIEELSSDFIVYPVPTDQFITVNMTEGSGTYSLELIDLNGKLINQSEISAAKQSVQMNLKDAPSGIYLLKVYNEDEVGLFKVIKR